MSNELIQKNAELGRFLFCERYTLQPVKNSLYIAEGQDLKRGAVVDVKGVLVGTNSLMPYAVLENDCDTRAKGAFASVFVKGEFNFDKLFFADGLSKNDLDNIVYNGSGTGLVFKPYDYDAGFVPAMVPTGTSGGAKTESDIISGIFSIKFPGSWTKLKLTSLKAVKIKSNIGVPNFAITVDNTGNDNSVVVTVEDEKGNLLKKSAFAGNVIPAGKTVQVTAVGDCFTLAVFE